MKTTTALLVTSAVVLVSSCGSDSSAGDVDAFCDEIRRAENEETVDLGDDFEAGMAEMERFRDLAPSEIRDDIDVMIEKFEELGALESESSGDEEDDFAAMMALIFDPEFIAAGENLDEFGVEECGLEPSDSDSTISFDASGEAEDPAGSDDVQSADASDAASGDGELVTEPADVPDPLYDPFFDNGPLDLGEVSYEAAQYFIDVNHTDAPWRTKLGSWSLLGGDPLEIGVGGLDLTDAEATEVCGALLSYLQSMDEDGSIVVSTYGQADDGSFGDEDEVIRTTVADGC